MNRQATYRVLLADELAPAGVEILESSDRLQLDARTDIDPAELQSVIGEYDAVIVRSRTHLTADILKHADSLKVIGRAGVGVDNIDVESATRKGVIVLNAPGGNVISVAEHTLALILALVRKIPQADASVRRGEWKRGRFKGVELYGKTLGLAGAGRIGSEVAKRARSFGMRVEAYDPYLSRGRAEQVGIELVTLPDLLEGADFVSVHTPLTDETRGMIGAKELGLMKPNAYLINAARGGVVDEGALYETLKAGRLAGAALDVFEKEPITGDNPLLELDNVVVVPHLGAATREAQASVAVEICEAVRDALLSSEFRTAVNVPELAVERYADIAPVLNLANRMGRLLCGLARGSFRSLEVRYGGAHEQALRAVAAGAVQGLLCDIVEAPLTLVNALHLASDRGVGVTRAWLGSSAAGEQVELRLRTAEDSFTVAGVLLAENHPRITRIGEYHLEIQPSGTILVMRNRDVPGVIGKVGNILGDAGVNIAEYHQARLEVGGEALAAIAVDGSVERAVVDRLAALDEVSSVWQISLPDTHTASSIAAADARAVESARQPH
ncbi:MAG: phosphoglycerate dehydrogenase [Gemmatimonadetes bacterium]|nr:phosphoglycerate dehydrogenase [Gemmatimonadota bacterium]NIS01464.1 phosphoglycerate dehydrogenase [Gemmatimonadota bacterium]NIT67205.1 phosphoglycerate dehydrogenase [Gemmatimonadota bacterium]NIU52379.1 phosphoglycerate dehydrogenase [Gemmatimonadota bacterium]NIV23988.1 phosphoglycerate dehydrogenase [Gemmatimonadota bacterium]